MINENQITNFEYVYHRNGVGGEPFYLCRFNFTEDDFTELLMAIVYPYDSVYCAVINPDDLSSKWRGADHFGLVLKALIDIDEEECYGKA